MAAELPLSRRLPSGGWLDVCLLLLWIVMLNSLGLGRLEFLHNTEADRALIGWEMAETGRYLVPHLLQSVILTKPPLFYWATAGSMLLLRSTAEWAARFPSLAASVLFVLAHYCFVRKALGSRRQALLASLILSTSGAFFLRAVLAEMDMLYGFLAALCLYCGYFALTLSSAAWLAAGYFFAGAATLTKGPPVLLFFCAVQLVFFLFRRLRSAASGGPQESWRSFLLSHMLCLPIAAAVVLVWLIPLAREVSWGALSQISQVEFVDRALSEQRMKRGPLFYFFHFFSGLAPWSFFLLAFGFVFILEKERRRDLMRQISARADYLMYNLAAVGLPLLMLSLSSGKSGRYWFPVHAFGVNLCAAALYMLAGTLTERRLYTAGKVVGIGGALTFAGAAAGSSFSELLPGVSAGVLVEAGLLGCCGFLILAGASQARNGAAAVAALALLALPVRFVQNEVYAPYRNLTRSVKPYADKINALVPPDVPIYTFEMYERWLSYYLKQLDRENIRLTAESCRTAKSYKGQAYLLFSKEQENWRINELKESGAAVVTLAEMPTAKDTFMLVEMEAGALCRLNPPHSLPT